MIGQALAHYTILEKLGEGGMGVVYKARDTHLDRVVAIKVLPPEKVADPERKRRFVQEAKAASALNHPNIITIYDIDTAGGVTFIAMEYVKGKTLDRLIHGKGTPLNETLKHAVQIADALAAAHAAGIIHRDIKPGNIMVTEAGLVKVLDFGLAKLTEIPESSEDQPTRTLKAETEEGVILGTIAYMSPEQAEGKKVDGRSDIFSFGSVLYEMTTGRRAFSGETKASTLAAILREEPKPVSQVAVETPREMERIISRCLRKEANRRYQHMDDVKIALEELKEESESGEAAVTRPTERKKSRRWWLAAGVLVGVLSIALATGLWPIDVPQVERVVQLTNDTTLKGFLISDGNRVLYDDSKDVWSVPASGGEPKRLSLPFLQHALTGYSKVLTGYSPIRQEILLGSLHTGKSGGNEYWLAGPEGEAPHKIAGEFKPSYGVALAPDAERIAVSTPDGIYIQSIENGERKRVHPLTGTNALWWHPSGHTLGFLDNPNDLSKIRAWQVNDDGTHLRRIVPEREHGQGSGAWSQDGKRFFYTAIEGEVFLRIQGGILGWLRKPVVTRLTASGQFGARPTIDPVNPRRLYVVGSVYRGETMRYDRKARRWVSFLGGLSGEMIDRSPDGQWVAYIEFPGAALHKCRIDGSGDVLLAPGVWAVNPRWSPDGKQIAFSGRPAGTLGRLKLWLVSSGGGDAAPYSPEVESGYETIWSGDGKGIMLGRERFAESPQSRIRILHLETGKLEVIPGTERLFSPRWSPGEKQILALEDGTMRARILDPVKGEWRPLTEESIGYPTWSRDGKYIYGLTGPRTMAKAVRIEVATGRHEEIARKDFKTTGNYYNWVGWTEDWEPLTLRDVGSTQVYRIDLDR